MIRAITPFNEVREPFLCGGALLAAYTFSKLIGDSESLTPWLESNWNAGFQYWGNLKAERSLATLDVHNGWLPAMYWICRSVEARSIFRTCMVSPARLSRVGELTGFSRFRGERHYSCFTQPAPFTFKRTNFGPEGRIRFEL